MSDVKQTFKYYDLLIVAFVTVLLCSNLIGASKIGNVFGLEFGTGVFFFPISYVFGDVMTEVYGYKRARRAVWAGFTALLFASLMSAIVLAIPPASGWGEQAAYETVFGSTPRLVMASLLAFFVGEFANSMVLAKLKVATEGKRLWLRTIGSTIVGEAIDSLIFYPLAFLGRWPLDLVLRVMLFNYCAKVAWEVLATPLTYRLVGFLKRKEEVDVFDTDTRLTPFSLEI